MVPSILCSGLSHHSLLKVLCFCSVALNRSSGSLINYCYYEESQRQVNQRLLPVSAKTASACQSASRRLSTPREGYRSTHNRIVGERARSHNQPVSTLDSQILYRLCPLEAYGRPVGVPSNYRLRQRRGPWQQTPKRMLSRR